VQPVAGLQRPQWLDSGHDRALQYFRELGLPTRALEDWKYLRIDALFPQPVTPAGPAAASGGNLAALIAAVPDLPGPRLVFVNGFFAADLSHVTAAAGVQVDSFAAVAAGSPTKVPAVAADLVSDDTAPIDGLAALNRGLFDDGAVIDIGAGVCLDEPIHLVFVTTDAPDTGEAVLASPRSVVVAGAGSQVVLVETHIGTGTRPNVSNASTIVTVGAGASVRHITLQDVPVTASHLGVVEAHLGDGGTFEAHTVALGAKVARHELRLHLDGTGTEAHATGLYLPTGEQYHDNPVLVDHRGPDGTSTQTYNGVLDGRGHGVFNGRIIVRPSGAGADATQSNRNLVLSDHAEVDTRPRLEILADDVACSHGATVGQLDEEAVHYLRSRGIPADVARGMLTYAFANEMVRRTGSPALISWIHQRVTDRFPGLDPTEVVTDGASLAEAPAPSHAPAPAGPADNGSAAAPDSREA
jgi:Fe-S cluster assembly protein SufD